MLDGGYVQAKNVHNHSMPKQFESLSDYMRICVLPLIS